MSPATSQITRTVGLCVMLLGLAIGLSPYYRPLKRLAATVGAPPALVFTGIAAMLIGGWLMYHRRPV